jgi:hypothetical protein
MPHFLFAYHGGKMPETEAETEAEIARWQGWFDNISAAIVDPGNPTGESRTVLDTGIVDDGGPNPLSGYSIVMADSIDAAVAMARDCPIIGNGSVEVAEIHEFTM